MLTPTETAQAFSGHRFAEAYPMLADDVVWDNVNGPQLSGRDAVIAACEETLGFLRHATTTFSRFVTVTGEDAVVVDVEARYVDDDGSDATVASCDLYTFADGVVTAIRSYTAEVTGHEDVTSSGE